MNSAEYQVPQTVSKMLKLNNIQEFSPQTVAQLSEIGPSLALDTLSKEQKVDLIEELCAMDQAEAACVILNTKSSEFDLSNPRALLALGNAYHFCGKLPQAKIYYQMAEKLQIGEPSVFTNLAMIDFKQGDLKASKVNALRALEIYKDHGTAWTVIAQVHQQNAMELDEIEISAKQLDSWMGKLLVLNLKESETSTKVELLMSYFQQGNYDNELIIELTGQLGQQGEFDKMLKIIWQAQNKLQYINWQILLHACQAGLALQDVAVSKKYYEALEKSGHPLSVKPILSSIKQEIEELNHETH